MGSTRVARRAGIVASAAIVFRHAPLGADPAVLFHAVEGGVEGTFFDAEDVFGNLLDVKSDAVAVHGRASEGLEDQEGEGALEKVVFGLEHRAPIDSYR